MKKVLLFDLDQTILNRNESLLKFLNWQVSYLNLVPHELKKSFINRFIELDNNGSVWKDIVYSQLIKDFNIKNMIHLNCCNLTLMILINSLQHLKMLQNYSKSSCSRIHIRLSIQWKNTFSGEKFLCFRINGLFFDYRDF